MRQFPCSSPQEWYEIVCVLLGLVLEPYCPLQTLRPLTQQPNLWPDGLSESLGAWESMLDMAFTPSIWKSGACMYKSETKICRFASDDVIMYKMDRQNARVCVGSYICCMRTWIWRTYDGEEMLSLSLTKFSIERILTRLSVLSPLDFETMPSKSWVTTQQGVCICCPRSQSWHVSSVH